MTEMNSLTPN